MKKFVNKNSLLLKCASYDLTDTIMTLPYRCFGVKGGPNESVPTMVFMSGFPDTELTAFSKIVPKFAEDYRVIACGMPGLGSEGSRDVEEIGWGWTFSQIVEMLDATISKEVSDEDQIILVGHDWGAYVSSMYENAHPKKVKKLILFDVAMFHDVGKDRSVYDILVSLVYQLWFGFSFFLSRVFFNALGSIVFKSYFVICKILPFMMTLISPLVKGDRCPRHYSEVRVDFTYPYYSFFRYGLFDSAMWVRFPSCPMLFIYGKKKNVKFHNAIDEISKREDCDYLGLGNAGHWVMHEEPTRCITIMIDFLKRN
jgi:pimeloyl-ACP methyl ester carboxylesterase